MDVSHVSRSFTQRSVSHLTLKQPASPFPHDNYDDDDIVHGMSYKLDFGCKLKIMLNGVQNHQVENYAQKRRLTNEISSSNELNCNDCPYN